MSGTRFRSRPALPGLPKGAERELIAQFRAIEHALDEVQGVERNATPVLNVPAYMAKPGELVLLEGNAGGTLVTIPPGSSFNVEQTIRVALVRGVLSPGVTISIVGRVGTINGAATLVMTARGIVELTSVGDSGWVAIDAGGGGGGEDWAATLVLGNASGGTDVNLTGGSELQVAGNPGALGEVLTSQGPGVSPIWAAAAGGSFSLLTTEVNLGAGGVSGSFTIAGAGMTPGRPVLCVQAVGPYTGKGALEDVAEEPVWCTAVVTSAVLITVYWQSNRPVGGNVKFNYAVG